MSEKLTPQTEDTAPPPPTWTSVTSESTDAPPAVDTAPAEAPTLEPDVPPLPVETAPVREEEAPPPIEEDKDVEEGDPQEVLALPSGSSSRKWARRQFHDAAPIRAFDDLEKPIQHVGDELYKRSESRYFELVDDILANHTDYAAQRLFGAKSFKEAKERLTTPGQPATTAPTTATVPTAEEIYAMNDEQIAQRMADIQKAKEQEVSAKYESEVKQLREQLEAVTGKITTSEQQAFQARVSEEQNKLYDKVWTTVIDGGIRESGLEVASDDPPKIANLKRAAARILKAETEPTFDAEPDNLKLIKTVVGFAQRGEFPNAWREQDNLTVRARTAFNKVKDSDEVKEILAQIEAYANQSKATSRATSPQPPALGASGGVEIKPPATWDEAIAGAAR